MTICRGRNPPAQPENPGRCANHKGWRRRPEPLARTATYPRAGWTPQKKGRRAISARRKSARAPVWGDLGCEGQDHPRTDLNAAW